MEDPPRSPSTRLFFKSYSVTPPTDVECQVTTTDYKQRGTTKRLFKTPDDLDDKSIARLPEWRPLMSEEQEKVMSTLKQEQVMMDKMVRLQQLQLHHEKEEAQIEALQKIAEKDLEGEQIREQDEAKVRMEESERRNSELMAFELKLQEHLQLKRVEDTRFEQLQEAHMLAVQQALKLQRNRDAYHKRLEHKDDSQMRDSQELAQWQVKTISNAEMDFNLRLKALVSEEKQTYIKGHALEIEHMKVIHARQGDQLKERQLVNQKQTAKSFEYEQRCIQDLMKLGALQLHAVQKLNKNHNIELQKRKCRLDMDMAQLKRMRRATNFELEAETATRKQRRNARELYASMKAEVEMKRQAWSEQSEDDSVQYMAGLDPFISAQSARSTDEGNPEVPLPVSGGAKSSADHSTEEEWRQLALSGKIQEEEGVRQTNNIMRIRMLIDSHTRVLEALNQEHSDERDSLLRENVVGAKSLRDRMESELKTMRQSQAVDMGRLIELQEKSMEVSQRAVTLELKTMKVLERERTNLLDFLGFVCHELRNPMCAISGLTELLVANQTPDNPLAYTETILTQCSIMRRIVDDVLDLSKIEEGKVDLKVEQIDLADLLESTVAAYRLYGNDVIGKEALPGTIRRTRNRLVITSKIEEGSPRIIYGDNVRVRQILGNLVSNAIKFTYEGSVTIIASQTTKGQLTIAVQDTGLGISTSDQRKLFGKYDQLVTLRPSTSGNTGLGLCITKSLVERMDGRIGVDSKPEEGSTFWFSLPLLEAPKARTHQTPYAPIALRDPARGPPRLPDLSQTSENLRVLIAEDNPVLQMTLRAMLVRLGITPVVVSNGADVVKACGEHSFDLLILDIQMPEMNGDTALIAVMQKGHRVQAIACTGDAMPHQIQQYRKAGFGAVLTKPFTFVELTVVLLEMGFLTERKEPGNMTPRTTLSWPADSTRAL